MRDKARADLLARIRKCLALAKSSNENEAAAAIAKARELMDAHGLTDEDVSLSEIGEASAKGNCANRAPMWEQTLSETVCHALGCTVILGYDNERIFIGPGAGPDVSAYAFSVLYRKLKAARAEYTRTKLKRCGIARKRQRADVFSEAWALAVYRQVKALMPQVARDARTDLYIAHRFGQSLTSVPARPAATKGRDTSNDYWAGHQRGREVELHNAVGGGKTGGGMLTHG